MAATAGRGIAGSGERVNPEYTALRMSAALVELGSLSVFELYGPDATVFLQGMITNDVKQLSAGEGCLAALLTPIGKLIADLVVLKRSPESYWLICRKERREPAMGALSRFIIADQVELGEVPNHASLGVFGPAASERLAGVLETLPSKPFAHLEAMLEEVSIRVVRDTRFGVDGYQLWMAAERKAECVRRITDRCNCLPAGEDAFETLRIEAGVPAYGIDWDETNIPLESNLDAALNFKKGCYTGQEVIARVTYLGSVSKKLMGLLVRGDVLPQRGEELVRDGEVAGHVTSAVWSPKLGAPIALAYVKRKFMDAAEVELKLSGTQAAVRPLPLVAG